MTQAARMNIFRKTTPFTLKPTKLPLNVEISSCKYLLAPYIQSTALLRLFTEFHFNSWFWEFYLEIDLRLTISFIFVLMMPLVILELPLFGKVYRWLDLSREKGIIDATLIVLI